MKKEYIDFETFLSQDLRVGKVVSAEMVPNSKKLIALQVDLGEDYGTVQILTGLAQWFDVSYFIDKHFCFLANLAPKEMAGTTSNGMLMAADTPEKPQPIEISLDIAPGSVVR